MKKTTLFGMAAAIALGFASLAAPANAASVQPAGVSAPMTDMSSQGYYGRDRDFRRGPRFGRGRVCETRTVVRRGPMGRRVVTKTRVCR